MVEAEPAFAFDYVAAPEPTAAEPQAGLQAVSGEMFPEGFEGDLGGDMVAIVVDGPLEAVSGEMFPEGFEGDLEGDMVAIVLDEAPTP